MTAYNLPSAEGPSTSRNEYR